MRVSIRRVLGILPALLVITACSELQIRTGRLGGARSGSDTVATYTDADVRAIMDRPRPVGWGDGRVLRLVCTEPSPDVAKALEAATTLGLKGGNGAASGSLDASRTSAEAALALAGRSTALLGLRDGLYRACEAYGNGVIGQDAYALLLGRYSQIMVTLFLGEDAAEGARGGVAVLPYPAALPQAPSGGEQQQQGAQRGGVPKAAASASAGMPAVLAVLARAAAPGAGRGDVAHRVGQHQQHGGSHGAGETGDDPKRGGTGSESTADALARMQQQYLAISRDLSGPLLVACVNEFDPTRLGDGTRTNSFLQVACGRLEHQIDAALHPGP